jgi:hypothetical protein
MPRNLALTGLLLAAGVSWGDPAPTPARINLPTPPSGGTPITSAPVPVTLPAAPVLPPPAQLMNPDWTLLPRRLGSAPAALDTELAAHQRELEQLRAEQAALVAEGEKRGKASPEAASADAAKAAQLRTRIAELLTQLEAKRPKANGRQETSAVAPTQAAAPSKTAAVSPPSNELLQQACDQFRAGQDQAALATSRRLDFSKLDRADRALVQYLTACCLRNLGRLDEAVLNYREVINSCGDEDLVQSASWQLKAVEVRRNLMRELAEIHERRPSP